MDSISVFLSLSLPSPPLPISVIVPFEYINLLVEVERSGLALWHSGVSNVGIPCECSFESRLLHF